MSNPNRTLKISLIVDDLSAGGTVRALLLAQIFHYLKYDVEIVGFQFGPAVYAEPLDHIPMVSIPGKNYPELLLNIKQIFEHINGDIIYAVKPKPTSFGLALVNKLSSNKPLILDMDDWEMSWYGGDNWQYKPSPKQLYRDIFKTGGQLREPNHPIYIKFLEKFVKKADALTVDTSFLKQRFGGVYLPNGKDTELFNPNRYNSEQIKANYGLSQYRILMFPGAPRSHKGVEDVLIALDLLNQPDLRLVIVGGSPYDDYDDQLRKKWGHWIIKLPRCSIIKMPEVIAAADVIVVPQRDSIAAVAQFPLKLTDGMAMAKPILATKVGDIPEILGGTGHLVDPNSPEQIAAKIQAIFANWQESINLGLQARQRCIDQYSLKIMGTILQQLITNLNVCQ